MKPMIKNSTFILILLLSGIVSSCGGGEIVENSLENELLAPDTTTTEISKEEIFDLIQSFPSPIEMALVIKNSDNDFSTDILLKPDSTDRFTTSFDHAMAMGAYGADMGYLNIFNKIFLIPDYLVTIRLMSVELDLDNFFDFETMLDMASNSDNIDTLIEMSTQSFNEMEAHLREKGRDELSLLIVFGTWLEGTYVIADVAKKAKTEEMYNRVAEQKDFIDKLHEIFDSSTDKYFDNLLVQLDPLIELYDEIEIEIIMKEATMEEVDGQLIFIDNSETIIHAEEDVIIKIIDEIINLRNNLLN